jgi:hypothetical protein
LIEVWRGPTALPGVKAMVSACEALLRDGRGDVSLLVVLERTAPPPGEPVRQLLSRWSRETVPRMANAIVVAEGGGFRASIVRGVCTALTLLAPHRVPFKFVATVDEGTNLLATLTATRVVHRDDLRAAVAEVRHQVA